jgi:hypothetical protein
VILDVELNRSNIKAFVLKKNAEIRERSGSYAENSPFHDYTNFSNHMFNSNYCFSENTLYLSASHFIFLAVSFADFLPLSLCDLQYVVKQMRSKNI